MDCCRGPFYFPGNSSVELIGDVFILQLGYLFSAVDGARAFVLNLLIPGELLKNRNYFLRAEILLSYK